MKTKHQELVDMLLQAVHSEVGKHIPPEYVTTVIISRVVDGQLFQVMGTTAPSPEAAWVILDQAMQESDTLAVPEQQPNPGETH